MDPHPAALGHQLMAENTLKVYETFHAQEEEVQEPLPAKEESQADLNGNPSTGDIGTAVAACAALAVVFGGCATLLRRRER